MKILMLSPHNRNINSGVSGLIEKTGAEMRKLGHTVDFIFRNDLKLIFRNWNTGFFFEYPRRIRKLINPDEYDILDIYGHNGFLISDMNYGRSKYIFRTAGLDTRYFRQYYLVQEELGEEKFSFKFKKRYNWIINRERIAIKNADGIIVMCDQDSDFILDNFEVKVPVSVISGGHTPKSGEVKSISERSRDIIVVSWFGKRKGFKFIKSALEKLIKLKPGITITLAGTIISEDKVRQELSPDLNKRVEVIPFLENEKLLDLIEEHKIFLFPTLFEGFGIVFIEAMSRGTVVIGTPAGGMPEYIEDGDSGIIIPLRNDDAIVKSVVDLLDDHEKLERISNRSIEVSKKLTWKNAGDLTLKFYEQILEGN